jgi:hypothetical protein
LIDKIGRSMPKHGVSVNPKFSGETNGSPSGGTASEGEEWQMWFAQKGLSVSEGVRVKKSEAAPGFRALFMNVFRQRMNKSARRRNSLVADGLWDTEEHGQGFCAIIFRRRLLNAHTIWNLPCPIMSRNLFFMNNAG